MTPPTAHNCRTFTSSFFHNRTCAPYLAVSLPPALTLDFAGADHRATTMAVATSRWCLNNYFVHFNKNISEKLNNEDIMWRICCKNRRVVINIIDIEKAKTWAMPLWRLL
ncbi:hypothetical protein LXL04_006757 [Taraxacum kok-saghyz]